MSFSKKVEYHVDQWSVYNHVFQMVAGHHYVLNLIR